MRDHRHTAHIPARFFPFLLLLLALSVLSAGSAQADGKCTQGNCKNGQGTFAFDGGDTYVGGWVNGQMHGQGTYTWKNGEKFVGEFKNNKTNGRGVRTWPNGNRYEGQEKDGVKDGFGTLSFANGEKYVGEFKNDKTNGRGVRTWANGERYEGQEKDGLKDGFGTLTFANGEKFVGEFKNDKTNGRGVRTWASGARYEGEEKEGLKDGFGTLTLANGEKFVGRFKNDKIDGSGEYTWPNGDRYVGEYAQGKRSGLGLFTSPRTATQRGVWANDDFVQALSERDYAQRAGGRVQDSGSGDLAAERRRLAEEKTRLEAERRQLADAAERARLEEERAQLERERAELAELRKKPAKPHAARPKSGAEGRRVALVIGNGAYKEAPLRNPSNDARDIAASLRSLGFEVILRQDADLKSMERAIDDFYNSLKKGGTGLFYFAGHGIQVGGINYLVPVGARIASESDVRYQAVDAGRVLGKMEDAGNGLNLVILDACRNNPFARSFRSAAGMGLAKMDAPTGSFIAYATAPGSVAADGSGKNGVYTKHLLLNVNTPGLSVEELFKRVRLGVVAETGKKQVPWEASSLTGSFSFAE